MGAAAEHCSDRSHVDVGEAALDVSLSQLGKLLNNRCVQEQAASDTKQHLRGPARHRLATDVTWADYQSSLRARTKVPPQSQSGRSLDHSGMHPRALRRRCLRLLSK